MSNNERIELFQAAHRALEALKKAPSYSPRTIKHLDVALTKLHTAYGSELIAGLKPEEGDQHGTT